MTLVMGDFPKNELAYINALVHYTYIATELVFDTCFI